MRKLFFSPALAPGFEAYVVCTCLLYICVVTLLEALVVTYVFPVPSAAHAVRNVCMFLAILGLFFGHISRRFSRLHAGVIAVTTGYAGTELCAVLATHEWSNLALVGACGWAAVRFYSEGPVSPRRT